MRCARKPCGDGCPCAHAAAFSLYLSIIYIRRACPAVVFRSRSLLRFARAPPPPPAAVRKLLPRRPSTLPSNLLCLVPAAAAVQRGDGDATRWRMVLATLDPPTNRWVVDPRCRVQVPDVAFAIIEPVAGAHIPGGL